MAHQCSPLGAARLEMGQRCARAQHDAGEIDGDQPVPIVERGVPTLADEDTGIVDQHIEVRRNRFTVASMAADQLARW